MLRSHPQLGSDISPIPPKDIPVPQTGLGILVSRFPTSQRETNIPLNATLACKAALVNPYGLGKSLLKVVVENNINPICCSSNHAK